MEPTNTATLEQVRTSQDAAKKVLLLDCDDRRREARAEAMLSRGLLVDHAAATGVARGLWKPGAYDLVLIDLRGADADCAAFISFIEGEYKRQKFGFYLAQPPYLTASITKCRTLLQRLARAADPGRGEGANQGQAGPGLVRATRRITEGQNLARVRPQTREPAESAEVREERTRDGSISEALRIAGRVLGGS